MCIEGFEISNALADAIKKSEKMIRSDPGLFEIFVNDTTNDILKRYDMIKMPKLAETMRIISETNITEFYGGNLAQTIVKEINENGIYNSYLI